MEFSGALVGEVPAGLLRCVREVYEGHQKAGSRIRRKVRSEVWAAPVVIIDGRSGSGKSTLARSLAQHLRMAGIRGLQLTGPDQWYPGWYGLEQGAQTLIELLTGTPHANPAARHAHRDNRTCGYYVWDWGRSRPGQYVRLDRHRPVLIEGVGSLRPATAQAADLMIWVECEGQERRSRAIARDGATYEPWWDVWAAQEDEHIRVNQPQSLADVIVRTMA